MNGACTLRKLMVVASVQHISPTIRMQLSQNTLIHAIVIGAQSGLIRELTLEDSNGKCSIPFAAQAPGEYLVDYVMPYHEIAPLSTCVLQIDVDTHRHSDADNTEGDYALVYGITLSPDNMAPLGKFLPELISLLYYYDIKSTKEVRSLNHPIIFTLYAAGYAALHARQFSKASFYFERLSFAVVEMLPVKQLQQLESDQDINLRGMKTLSTLALTRILAVVEQSKNESRHETIAHLYKTMQWFFTAVFNECARNKDGDSAQVFLKRRTLFREYYTALIDGLPDSTIARSQHGLVLEICIINCVYDLLFLILIDSIQDLTSVQLTDLLCNYLPNSSTVLCLIYTNYKEAISFVRSPSLFETAEKAYALAYILGTILQVHLTSLSPELLLMVITPFITHKMDREEGGNSALAGQIITTLQDFRGKIACFSSTALFRLLLDTMSVLDQAMFLNDLDTERGQLIYSILMNILSALETSKLFIDFSNFTISQQLSATRIAESIKVYWDLERYIKSFTTLSRVCILIMRKIRHMYIHLHTLGRKLVKLIGDAAVDPANEQHQEAMRHLQEKYKLTNQKMSDVTAFLGGSLSPMNSELELATRLSVLLGNVFGTVLLQCKENNVTPSNELLISLNSYLYTSSACIGLVLCNMDEIPIPGVPVAEQKLYSKVHASSETTDITVQAPLIIDFKLSELVESKMQVYKPLSTDVFKYPNLSNVILHLIGNFFAGFGFCASTFAPSSLPDLTRLSDKERRDNMRGDAPRQQAKRRMGGSLSSISMGQGNNRDCEHGWEQKQGRERPVSQSYAKDTNMDTITVESASSDQTSNTYLSLISYYYAESSTPFPFLKPVAILLNTLFASGIILGNRIAHKNKEERVYHCSLSIVDLGLEKLTSNELYTLAENIWYFIRYYSSSLMQSNMYSDLLFSAYLLEFLRFSSTNALNEVLLAQFFNYSKLYSADSLIYVDFTIIHVLESCFPTYILLDLPSIRDMAVHAGSNGVPSSPTKLSVEKALAWFQTVGFSTSKFYVLTELFYAVTNQILRHSKYQMFQECYGILGQLICIFESLMNRLYDLDSKTVEAYTYLKHYVETLRLLTAKVGIYLSTRFIPSSYLYKQALKNSASLLLSAWCLKNYNDTLMTLVGGQSKPGVLGQSRPGSHLYISSSFLMYVLHYALLHNLTDQISKLQQINFQILKLVTLSWGYLKRSVFFSSVNICEFAQICALFTIFELIILPSCEDSAISGTAIPFFSDLAEYVGVPLFLFVYTKTLVGAYNLLSDILMNKQTNTRIIAHDIKCVKFLELYTSAIRTTSCARIHVYAFTFLKLFIPMTQSYVSLPYKLCQQIRSLYIMVEAVVQEWGEQPIDFQEVSAISLMAELETPLNQKVDALLTPGGGDLASIELLSVPELKSLTDISIIPVISDNTLQHMQAHRIVQAELPHYTAISELKQLVATQFAIAFSFTVPFVGSREAVITADLQQLGGTDSGKEDLERRMDRMDGIDSFSQGLAAQKINLTMGQHMPTYAVVTNGQQVERRYSVIYCKGLMELAANAQEAARKQPERPAKVEAAPDRMTGARPMSARAPALKTNELARRYMSREERERRAQYLLKNAMEEFAMEEQSDTTIESIQDIPNEEVGVNMLPRPDNAVKHVPARMAVSSTDSSEHDSHEAQQSIEIEATFADVEKGKHEIEVPEKIQRALRNMVLTNTTQEVVQDVRQEREEEHAKAEAEEYADAPNTNLSVAQIVMEFSGGDNEYVEFNPSEDIDI